MQARVVHVAVGERSYDIFIGGGTLGDRDSYRGVPADGKAVLVTNETLAPLYGDRVRAVLQGEGRLVETIVLPDGEEHKVWSSVLAVLDAMFSMHCDRKTVVFALGGGVLGDIAGFAAACYMRGVKYVQIPTTLLAQVDSSVGGKTGVNHSAGKNLIGAFHQPARVVIDLDLLDSLPPRQFLAGLAEVIKYGVACDEGFLTWIERNLSALLRREKGALLKAVSVSCEIKARVVAADEHELGPRAVLNFGHTFAHAIETGTGYATWLHGEAVACGMVLAADLSARLGMVGPELVERIVRVVRGAGLPVRPPALGVARYLDLMRADKKSQGGELRFVLLQGPGRAVLAPVAAAEVARTLEARASGDRAPAEN
jgi:3-dehydroquinate synthase